MMRSAANLATSTLRRTCAIALAAAAVGCVGPQTTRPPQAVQQTLLIAARYEWEPLVRGDTGRPLQDVRSDFEKLRALGFNVVWPDYVSAGERPIAADMAHAAELDVMMSDPRIDRYVEWGTLPPDTNGPTELIALLAEGEPRANVWVAPTAPVGAMIGRAVEASRAMQAAPQPQSLLTLVGANAPPSADAGPALWLAMRPGSEAPADGDAEQRPRRVLLLEPQWQPQDAEAADTTLQTYHRGLAAGLTDGMLVWRYRCWPGETNGVAATDGSVTPRMASTLQFITARARAWGPFVAGARPATDASMRLEATHLRATLLMRGPRRVILVHNEDAEHFARGTLSVGTTLAERPVSRILRQDSGERFLPRDGQCAIDLHIAPGDAALFEVF